MATIQDVAIEAGVSIATVSRVIHKINNVSPETKERVEEAISRLDYHPNAFAQQLRKKTTSNILVIIPELGNSFFHEIIAGIEEVARENGFHVLIVDTHNQEDVEAHFLESLTQKQVDGIITFSPQTVAPIIKKTASKYPVVVACRYMEDILPNVAIDNKKASYDMTSYVISLGHSEILYFTGPEKNLLYQDRLNGYKLALEENGIPISSRLIKSCDASIQGGYELTKSFLRSGEKFSAIVTAGDTMAVGAIRALHEHGISVPEDISVTGFDDIELSTLLRPALTTVRQPKRQMGIIAMEKLLNLIYGKQLYSPQEILAHELVIRESTGKNIKHKK